MSSAEKVHLCTACVSKPMHLSLLLNHVSAVYFRTISRLQSELEAIYGKAEVDRNGKVYRIEPEFEDLMSNSRNYSDLLWGWVAWRNATGPQMRPLFGDLVDALNEAARDNGEHAVQVGRLLGSQCLQDKNLKVAV